MKCAVDKQAVLAFGLAVASWSTAARADGFFEDLLAKTTFNAALRTDAAIRTSGENNQFNQSNLPFQHVDVPRTAYVPPSLTGGLTTWAGLTAVPAGATVGGVSVAYSDTVRRADYIPSDRQDINYLQERFSAEMNTKFTDNLQFTGRVRAIVDPTVYGGFNAADVSQIQGGISGGGGYRGDDTGRPDYYGAKARNGRSINPFEISGRNYEFDFPTVLIDYKKDNYDIRFGNQQIAWGQAIFFQTFDVPNGLDLRRHLILDRAIEEFEDKRVPSLALRATMQVNDTLLIDGFVSKFQPSILPNPNTSYNVIPVSFYKPLDNYFEHNYDWKPDFGFRLKDDFGSYGVSGFAVSRLNPLGVFRWAESGINKGLPNTVGSLGSLVNAAYMAKSPNCAVYNPTTCRLYGSTGEALAHSPFTVGPGGVYSGEEWFATAGSVRLNGQSALNTVINQFPALQDLYASDTKTVEETIHELDTFFIGSGGSLRGNVEREYKRENVVGLGGSYVTDSDIGALNEIILNLEGQYTPKRYFTSPDLSVNFMHSSEYIVSLVAEKWTRWSAAYPAAYLVFEAQHRSESDLVGLSLKGYSGNDGNSSPQVPDGISSADYLVFAGFQPTPNKKFVFEWAFLYDVRGGLLVQPEVQWNIGRGKILEVFYNYTNGHLYGNPQDNLIRSIENDDEISMRFTYQL